MLPALNDQGDLPPGIYVAGLAEIEARFGTGSPARVLAFATLKRLYDLARRTGLLRNFYVFGSFVSSTPEPRDVDVVLIMGHAFEIENCPGESRPLFHHGQAQARYGASVFWTREQTMTEPEMSEFIRVWQEKRDGTLRGILEVA
jgi:hypothetical protein